ncbi:DNA polymerase III, tau subunit / DNA polymerase III, gamma subunit [Psychromonas ingrahamii 37]|uniref:DNA polymerase III subunit gamma/tau n=1 Tax=Psychromonas ingrahamii (strain DSM 17664 / CCUG 51855 / 37) TaxID=357804 RepID=A1SX03_PSYIN|nr:DNA polymerase III subunit gamma/tau [Psychromonas ingrahamii]ABM04018.1 DNA polymerase III, tau subunit / DNA polymerase III, gamma subunit [Psychromonas ingrahamii 37]
MSYQVLARKWRPGNFQEVVGQQHVLTALSNSLAQNRLHHAYLFSGTRGVGKTTIARILAKSLNCEKGVTATPCGACVHCQAIDQGRFVDLLEIDAASRTKVDDTREMLDNVQYKPAQGRYKVYLIDEVHMLSKHSFNALLKTLEEPPEYVKFLLATTDPQKLPITVLSRCLQFHLKAILPQEIETQLAYILNHEQATFEHAALTVIATAAEGSMRDALSLTDQALAFGSGHIAYQSVLKMLGSIDNNHLHYLLHFIASGNVSKVFLKIDEFVHLGADFAMLHQTLASLCHEIALSQMQPKQNVTQKSAVQLLAERLTPEEVQLYYQIAVQGYKDYAFAPNGKIAFEMTVMRLLAFKPANYISLDERQLGNPNSAEASDAQQSNIAAASESVESVEIAEAPVIENLQQNPAASQIVQQEPKSADSVQSTSPSVEPLQRSAASSVPPPIERQPEPQQNQSAPPSEKIAPVAEVSHSRNMLRSHRLKRESAKKNQATTTEQPASVVASGAENVTAEFKADKYQMSGIDEDISSTPDLQGVNRNNAIADNLSAIQDNRVDQEIIPLESYQQDQFVPDSDNQEQPADYLSQTMSADYGESRGPENILENKREEKEPAVAENKDKSSTFLSDNIFVNDDIERAEIDPGKYVADKLSDPWALAIQKMRLVGLVKLLAKNSVMKIVEQQIVLTLKPEQQHLLNNHQLCTQLETKLKVHFGAQMSMYVEVGHVTGKLTAFESELAIYQTYLNNAKTAIKEDQNILTFVSEYGAKVYENSIIPL